MNPSTVAAQAASSPQLVRRALAFEWAKARSLRSVRRTALAAFAITPVIAAFVGLTRSLQDDDTVLGGSLTGSVPALVVAGVVGALIAAGEWSSGMARTTFTAVPRRGVVILAKSALTGMGMFVAGAIASAVAFAFGRALLPADEYATGDPFPALIGVGLIFGLAGALGVGIGAITRGSAGAVLAMVALVLLPSMLAPLFGDAERWIGGTSLPGVLQKLTQTSDVSAATVGSVGPWPSLLVLAAATTIVVGFAAHIVNRRDV